MKQLKRMVSGGFIGIGIGHTVNLIFSAVMGSYSPGVPSFIQQFDSELMAVTMITLVYLILGILQQYASLIMENEVRSLLVNTMLHYIMVVLPVLLAAYFLHWTRSLTGLISIGVLTSLVYAGIWIIIYQSIRREILKINESIKERNQ